MTFRKLVMLHFFRPITLNVSTLKKAIFKTKLLALAWGKAGIRFRNGEPLFSSFAIATVKLRSRLTERYGGEGTMPAADKMLAERLNMPEHELRQWINDHQFVWHERQDGRRIDLLPHDIHSNIPHSGGISANRQRVYG